MLNEHQERDCRSDEDTNHGVHAERQRPYKYGHPEHALVEAEEFDEMFRFDHPDRDEDQNTCDNRKRKVLKATEEKQSDEEDEQRIDARREARLCAALNIQCRAREHACCRQAAGKAGWNIGKRQSKHLLFLVEAFLRHAICNFCGEECFQYCDDRYGKHGFPQGQFHTWYNKCWYLYGPARECAVLGENSLKRKW